MTRLRTDPSMPRGGFTLIEIAIVLVIATVLLGIMFGSFRKGAAERSAVSARDTYIWMSRKARALAIQRGLRVRLRVVPDSASVVLTWRNPGAAADTVVDAQDFRDLFGTTVATATSAPLVVTYNPRGFAVFSPGLPTTVRFTREGQSAIATVQVLGQVEATQ